MRFLVAKYQQACSRYDQEWKATDDALYALCERFPNHRDRGGVNAKLWIIGRTYATGIERKIASKGTQGSSMEQLSDYLWTHRREVDKVLASLQGVDEPLTPEFLTTLLVAHGQLISLVQRILRKSQTPRSFVSKYLHFHNPAVPIYDSVAVRAMRKQYPRQRNGGEFRIPPAADLEYGSFLFSFWQLYKEARASVPQVTVKLLDHYLLALAKEAK